MSYKKTKYHIAIDGQGYLLRGSPEKPKRTMKKAPVFGNRFASGDRDYTDLSFWWFWAQTDWSGGAKHEKKWADDAQFHYSINIDTWSDIGSFKCAMDWTAVHDFAENITCGDYGKVASVNNYYIGVGDSKVYKSTDKSSWTEFFDGSVTNINNIWKLFVNNDKVWIGANGTNDTDIVHDYDNTTLTDHSAAIIAAMTGTALTHCFAITALGADIYAGVKDSAAGRVSLMKYSASVWTELATWADGTEIIDVIEYLGDIYYLKGKSGGSLELRYYDVSASTDNLIKTFHGISYNTASTDWLFVLNGKLVVAIPPEELWEYDGVDLIRIYKYDDYKQSLGGVAQIGLASGGVLHDNKVWFINLMYDGEYFYNTVSNPTSENDLNVQPLFTDGTLLYHRESTTDASDLYSESTTVYRGTTDKNYLVFNTVEEISTIDKLAHSVIVVFDTFDVGEEIEVKYSIDNGSTWISLGKASYTLDGASATQKTFKFGDDIIYNKMILRVFLNGDGTSSPDFKDISLQYLPMPDYKYQWSFQINCTNDITLLDGRTKEPMRGEELRNLLRASFLKQKIIELEDVDYAETQLNEELDNSETEITVDSTDKFPEQGTIRIEDEEIKYTSKSAIDFKGCTRGYRGTTAVTHSDDTAVNNKYKALIVEYDEQTPIAEDYNPNEYIVQIALVEA